LVLKRDSCCWHCVTPFLYASLHYNVSMLPYHQKSLSKKSELFLMFYPSDCAKIVVTR
jgi:hypothetical protein